MAVIYARSFLDSFEMETRTSKVVTLSFSMPMGEILVTLSGEFLIFKRFHGDTRRLSDIDLAEIAFVDLALDINFR